MSAPRRLPPCSTFPVRKEKRSAQEAAPALAVGDEFVLNRDTDHPITLRMRDGYDHSYFFINTFIDDHLRHHAAALGA